MLDLLYIYIYIRVKSEFSFFAPPPSTRSLFVHHGSCCNFRFTSTKSLDHSRSRFFGIYSKADRWSRILRRLAGVVARDPAWSMTLPWILVGTMEWISGCLPGCWWSSLRFPTRSSTTRTWGVDEARWRPWCGVHQGGRAGLDGRP